MEYSVCANTTTMAFLSGFLLICSMVLVKSQEVTYLDSSNIKWTVQNETGQKILAMVPGSIYSDLMRAKHIPDILKDSNELALKYLANSSWTYTGSFNVTENMMKSPKINLILEGVDTVATVLINEKLAGKTSNMFQAYKMKINGADQIKVGQNELTIKLQSAVVKASSESDAQRVKYPIPPECPPKEFNGFCHVNFLRKMQSSFGSSVGPAIPSLGIWKPMRIEFWQANAVALSSFRATVTEDVDVFRIKVELQIDCADKCTFSYDLSLQTDSDDIKTTPKEVQVMDGKLSEETINIEVNKTKVKRWWPNGYGEPKLYTLTANLKSGEQKNSSRKIKIGFRKVELVQTLLGGVGSTYGFKINDVEIFAKGANWLPLSILPERMDDEDRLGFLMRSAKEANFNMLKVWAGGVYESDDFYDMADQLGLMVWQEMPFINAMYPGDESFTLTVKEELKQEVERLQRHPSLVALVGNNEIRWALDDNRFQTKVSNQYREDYNALFELALKDYFSEKAKSFVYIESTPNSATGRPENSMNEVLSGDTHSFNYDKDAWLMTSHDAPRFVSEYGFQSFPSADTIANSLTNKTIKVSDLEHRQHLLQGTNKMMDQINKNLAMSASNSSETIILYSQISQAMMLKMATENYRISSRETHTNNEGKTMGALYFHLNDLWAAPTWSTIDVDSNWKMAHYYAKNFFAPTLIVPRLELNNELRVYIVNDKLQEIKDAVLEVRTYTWKNMKAVSTQKIDVASVAASSVQKAFVFMASEYLVKNNCSSNMTKAPSECFFYFTLHNKSGVQLSPDNFLLPDRLKNAVGLEKVPTIQWELKPAKSSKQFTIEITSKQIAPFVWLEAKGVKGFFSDNGFMLVEGSHSVTFTMEKEMQESELRKALRVSSLNGNTQKEGKGNGAAALSVATATTLLLTLFTLSTYY